jgi:hypothetical protein
VQGLPQADDKQKDKTHQDGQEWISRQDLSKRPSHLGRKYFPSGQGYPSTVPHIQIQGQNIGRCRKQNPRKMQESLQGVIRHLLGPRHAIQKVNQQHYVPPATKSDAETRLVLLRRNDGRPSSATRYSDAKYVKNNVSSTSEIMIGWWLVRCFVKQKQN